MRHLVRAEWVYVCLTFDLACASTNKAVDRSLRCQVPSREEIQEFEQALLAQGGLAQGTSGTLPDQLLVWRPENTEWDFFPAKAWEESLGIGSCLKRTVRGDRGFAYESGDGITALVDFQGPTFRTENFGYAAPCIFRPLCRPVPRSDLSRLTSLNTFVRQARCATKHAEPNCQPSGSNCLAHRRSTSSRDPDAGSELHR